MNNTKPTTHYPNTHQNLLSKGWVLSKNGSKSYASCYYKRFPTKRWCSLNKRTTNSGHQAIHVELAVSLFNHSGEQVTSYELEIRGQLKDGTSILILNHALPDNLNAVLRKIPRLIRIWEAE